jgi:hypothetical protein
MGAFGFAAMLVSTVVLTSLLTIIMLAHTGRFMMGVLQETAAGIDDIRWPDEPPTDWLLRAVRLGAILLLCLAPAGLLSRGLREMLFPNDPGLRLLVLAIPMLWLYFPIGLLSALSSVSGWALLRLEIVSRLLRILPSLLAFYGLTGVQFLLIGASWYFALFGSLGSSSILAVLLASVLTAAGVLLYARQLGRLAWLLSRVKVRKATAPTRATAKEGPPRRKKKPVRKKAGKTAEAHDPWAIPQEAPPEQVPVSRGFPVIDPDADSEPYALASDPTPPAPPPRARRVEEDEDPVPLREDEEPAPPPEPPSLPELSSRDAHLFERERAAPPPAMPLIHGVYSILLHENCLKAGVYLMVGYLAVGFCVRALMGMLGF